jgi:hypothetical protein
MQTTISTAKRFVKKSVKHELANGVHMPIYLHSSPGLGKSAVVKQVTQELDIGFVDVRLAQMEQSDVAGIPYVAHGDGTASAETMKVSVPEWFPSKEKIANGEFPEQGVLFFDECSNAPIAVQHAAYRIILDREVHRGATLGEGWAIVAAGNRKEDKTGAKGVAPALANRFAMHFDIGESVDDFLIWAYEAGLNEEIMGFLSFDASKLYMFDPKKNDVAFATPRSWEQTSNILNVGYAEDELNFAIGACVGDGVASEFAAFRKYYGKLPDMKKIMAGEETYKVDTKDNGVIFALTSSLVSNLIQNAADTDKIKNLHEIMKQLPDDFLIMLYKNVKGVFENQENKAAKESLLNILNTTLETFKRVSKYIRGGEIE